MYAAVIREGQIVESPSGRTWEVVKFVEGRVLLKDPENAEEVLLAPKLLRHIFTPRYAGQPLEALTGGPEEIKPEVIEEVENGTPKLGN